MLQNENHTASLKWNKPDIYCCKELRALRGQMFLGILKKKSDVSFLVPSVHDHEIELCDDMNTQA